MKFFVYVLLSRSRPKRTYVGWTVNLELRVARHNAGSGAKFTRGRKWTLIYAERHPSRSAAMLMRYFEHIAVARATLSSVPRPRNTAPYSQNGAGNQLVPLGSKCGA